MAAHKVLWYRSGVVWESILGPGVSFYEGAKI